MSDFDTTILVADDENSLRLLVKATLSTRKYTVLEACNGTDAVSMAKENVPTMILLDVMMPGLTGFQACSELRQDPITSNIPVIILTAKGGDDDKEIARSVGANGFLTKPFRPPKLLKMVDKVLSAMAQAATPS